MKMGPSPEGFENKTVKALRENERMKHPNTPQKAGQFNNKLAFLEQNCYNEKGSDKA